jgi:hypothetical protein
MHKKQTTNVKEPIKKNKKLLATAGTPNGGCN